MIPPRLIQNFESHKEYLEQRRQTLGASDIAALFNRDPYATPFHIYLEKTGEVPTRQVTARMKFGKLLEPFVAEMYEQENNCRLQRLFSTIVRHPTVPYLSCSPDCLLLSVFPIRPVECKTAAVETQWGEASTDDIPTHLLFQAQTQLEVLQLPVCDVAVFFGTHQFKIYTVERNEALGEMIIQRGGEFWKYVEERTPPPIDWGHDATVELFN